MTANNEAGAVPACPGLEGSVTMPESTTTPDHADHVTKMREAVAEVRGQGPDRTACDVLEELVDFAEHHGLWFTPDTRANLWGFGSAPIVLSDPDGGFWMRLFDLTEPTGLTDEQLFAVFTGELADQEEQGRSDEHPSVLYIRKNGARDLLVHHDFVMRAFAIHSPWRKEFYESTKELMSHAMDKSGLLDLFGASPSGFTAVAHLTGQENEVIKLAMPVLRFENDVPIVSSPFEDATDGEEVPITDLSATYEIQRSGEATRSILGPKVDEEEAVALAFRGPVIT